MKGYQIENILYIFPQDAAQIPSVAETVEAIAIQPELLEAFKAENTDYADIMFAYNYNTMTANPKAWAGHTNDDIEVPEPELPETGTVYNFTGYLTEDVEEPSSTGTITYEGEYSENTDYVYGTAEVTFVGSEQPQELTVYMTKEGFITTLDGGRSQVYTLESSEFVSLGYGELETIES